MSNSTQIQDLIKQIELMKYQIKTLAETIDHIEYPLQSLILSFNWTDSELNIAHDIFEKINIEIENGKTPNWIEFRKEMESKLGTGHQEIKFVIIAFYRNGMWTEVCRQYALSYPAVEMDFIIKKI